jgi:uncharacterized RDD family membrane protein YckC
VEKIIKRCPRCNTAQDAKNEECIRCKYYLADVDYYMELEYPNIVRRYFATVIDGCFILIVMITFSYIFQSESEMSVNVRIAIFLLMCFVYEPFFTSLFCTLGQKVTGIRVRTLSTHKRISIPRAYLRFFWKVLLGIISFFTIPFTKDKRAIHDFAVGSVVIYEKSKAA